jgi:hypothetical protein
MEIWYSGPETGTVDGIAFIGPKLYFNHLRTGKVYRMPINADGSAGTPVEIRLSQPLGGPDGMRALNGKLFVADNRFRQIVELALDGDVATVRVLKEGYQVPTGVAPVRGRIWVSDLKANYWSDPTLANTNPNPFLLQSLELPE